MKKILGLATGMAFIIVSIEVYAEPKKQLVPAFSDAIYEKHAKNLLQPCDRYSPPSIKKLDDILKRKILLCSQALANPSDEKPQQTALKALDPKNFQLLERFVPIHRVPLRFTESAHALATLLKVKELGCYHSPAEFPEELRFYFGEQATHLKKISLNEWQQKTEPPRDIDYLNLFVEARKLAQTLLDLINK